MGDTESHGPTWTLKRRWFGKASHTLAEGPQLDPHEVVVVARPEDIRSQVCQELAEKAHAERDTIGPLSMNASARRSRLAFAAEFVEQFGKADRGRRR